MFKILLGVLYMDFIDKLSHMGFKGLRNLTVIAALVAVGAAGCASGSAPDITDAIKELIPTPAPTMVGDAVPYATAVPARQPQPFSQTFERDCPSVEVIAGVSLDIMDTGYSFEGDPAVPISSTIRIRGQTVTTYQDFSVFAMNTDCNSEQLKGVAEIAALQSRRDCGYEAFVGIPSQLFEDMLYGDMVYVFAGPRKWGLPKFEEVRFEEVEPCRQGLTNQDEASIWACKPLRVCSPGFFNDEGECYNLTCDHPDNVPQQEQGLETRIPP